MSLCPSPRVRVAAALVILSLSVAGCSGSGRRPASPSDAQAPKPTIAPRAGASAAADSGRLTVKEARAVAVALWTRRDPARAADDDDTLGALEVDPQLTADLSRTQEIACGCQPHAQRHTIDDVVVLLPPGARPAYFIGFLAAHRTDDPGHSVEYQVAFVRVPDAGWRIAMVARAETRTSVGTSRVSHPKTTLAQGRRLLSDYGDDLLSWRKTGWPTKTHVWGGLEAEDGLASRTSSVAADRSFPATRRASFGVPNRSDVWVVGSPGGRDVVCGAVPATFTTVARPGEVLVQDDARRNWGPYLAPGEYLSISTERPLFTCVLTWDSGKHVNVLSGDDWLASATGVPAG
jgi:hypothetical protein